MIRVLQIGLSFESGGVESFVMTYYRHIDRTKIQFDFINPYDKPLAYEEEILKLGGKVYQVADFHKKPFQYKKDLKKIVPSYTVIHVHMQSAANLIPFYVAKFLNVKKIIAHSHSSCPEGLVRRIFHVFNYKKIIKLATDYFACSRLAGDWMFGKGVNYYVVQNAIEAEKYEFNNKTRNELRNSLGIPLGSVVYGNVGRLGVVKNQLFLVKVFSKLLEKQSNSILCIVGEGELRGEITSLSENLGISDKVRLLGRRHDVDKIYNIFDAIIMPSLFEGLPITLIEAQANGLKCFVSKDRISDECHILENMEFIDLDEGDKKWADEILNSNLERDDNAFDKITKAHFNISTETGVLEKKYIGV